MTKEEALQDFLKSLKIALNNSSIYFQNHPIFIKSAQDLKEKINHLLSFINPIKIGIASSSLFMEEKSLGKVILYEELARFFHFRKVKSLKIRGALSMAELTYFLAQACRSPREILKEGGMERILETRQAASIEVEDLDYSQILEAQGQAYKDIWVYLFRDVIDKKDAQKINQLTDNFSRLLGEFKLEDFLDDEELRRNLLTFLDYLRHNAKDKFYKCAQEIARRLMRFKELPREKIEKLTVFLKGLSPDDFADTLWQEIISDERFDASSFNLFINLVDKREAGGVASSLSRKASGAGALQITPAQRRKMGELLRSQAGQMMPEVYRQALARIFSGSDSEKSETLTLDRCGLQKNYRFLMLNIISGESSKMRLAAILGQVSDEWGALRKDRDFEFMRGLLETAQAKEKDNAAFALAFNPLKKHILSFVESCALEEGELAHFEYFLNLLAESSLTMDDYLKKIFVERKASPRALQLYLKLFPGGVPEFNAYIRRNVFDLDFLKSIIEGLRASRSPLSLEILKYMFSFSHLLIRLEALRAMRDLPWRDEEFLFSILKSRDVALKKEAFVVLAQDTRAQENALEILFNISSPFGIRNDILEENIRVVAQERASAQVAARLEVFSARRFFWNRNIRKAALAALEGQNAGKD